jgi:serine/threonine protein kinase
MSIAIAKFWKLAVESRLLTPADCQRLETAFTHVKGASNQANAVTLGEWLVANRALSRYQVQTLLAGRPGPFLFGDYCVYDRIRSKEGRLTGLYRAMHVATRHPVLLYFLSPEIVRNPDAYRAAAGQIAWASWVAHPFVSECHQLLDLGQFKVVVIENLVGESADARLAGGVRVMPHDACRLAYQAALGLARIHQLGLVHGEIRPENFWVPPDGNLKMLQVPLAPEPLRGPKALDWSTPTTKLLTAADYAAPELAELGRPPDALTDIYALGATLYHMLAGAPPFPGNDLDVKKVLHASEPVASLAKYGIPKQLDQVIAFMLAKDPRQRYQQAAQVAEAMTYFVDPARIGAAPVLAPTLPAYDQWLTGQARVPGMAPGSIPTTLQMLTYTAAQYAAAQHAAGSQQGPASVPPVRNDIVPTAAAPQTADDAPVQASSPFDFLESDAGELTTGYWDPSAQFDSPPADPLAFVSTKSNRPQLDMSGLDLSLSGIRAATEEMLADLSAESRAGGPRVAEDHGPILPPRATGQRQPAPSQQELDSVLDSMPAKSARLRPVTTIVTARNKNDLLTAGIIAGALAVAIVVGLVIVININRSHEGEGDLTLNPPTKTDQDGRSIRGDHSSTVVTSTRQRSTPAVIGSTTSTSGSTAAKTTTNVAARATPDASPAKINSANPMAGVDGPSMVEVSATSPDDGTSLWASPTTGPPLELRYAAPGAQAVLAARPANIVSRGDGDQILPALGPWGGGGEQMLKSLTGLPLSQIDQVLVVWHVADSGGLAPLVIVRTQEKLAAENLVSAWGNPMAAKEGDETYYQGRSWSYYLPAAEKGKLLVAGPADLVKESTKSGGATPAMPGHLERMLKASDADRDVSLAFIPGSLFADNQVFFSGELAALRGPAESFFGEDTKAGLLSLHFAGNLFIELRILATADKSPEALAAQFANRTRSIPSMVEDGLLNLNLHRYAKKLLLRFPEQLRVMAENTRSDVEDDMAVLRCYMPSVATHNLIFASELALAEQPVAASAGPATGAKNESIAELLNKKTTLTFPRDTLEKSLQMLLDEAGIKYEIVGSDLQLEGITKNQSFGLDEKDKTVGEILRKIMLLANPDGKLVYVIKPAQPGGPETLFITTRAAAAKRGDKLPSELEVASKTPPKKKKP